jgi:hypothetical protein
MQVKMTVRERKIVEGIIEELRENDKHSRQYKPSPAAIAKKKELKGQKVSIDADTGEQVTWWAIVSLLTAATGRLSEAVGCARDEEPGLTIEEALNYIGVLVVMALRDKDGYKL